MVHDMIQLELASKPSVPIVSHGFEAMAGTAAKAWGLPELKYVVVPRPYKMLTSEQAIAQTEPVVDDIIRLLTSTAERPGTVGGVSTEEERIRFQGVDRFEAYERFNEAFLHNDWGDGYPLLPPLEERVGELLKGTTRRPEDVICILGMGHGMATAEKIAVNAAMAGCSPEQLPVVIAGLQAIAKMADYGRRRGLLNAANAHAPLFLLNGPIVEELGVNGARYCLGPGRQNTVNIKIGRALMLAIRNIGHVYPGKWDMKTIGTPRLFNFCLAENERESPWEPFHVEQGYPREASTITVFSTAGERNMSTEGCLSPEHLIRQLALYIDCGSSEGGYLAQHEEPNESGRLLLLSPENARVLADGGFSKKVVKDVLHHVATQSARRLLEGTRQLKPEQVLPQYRSLAELPVWEAEKIFLPVVESPRLYHIVVVGSTRPKDLMCPVPRLPSTVEITDRA